MCCRASDDDDVHSAWVVGFGASSAPPPLAFVRHAEVWVLHVAVLALGIDDVHNAWVVGFGTSSTPPPLAFVRHAEGRVLHVAVLAHGARRARCSVVRVHDVLSLVVLAYHALEGEGGTKGEDEEFGGRME